MGNQKTGAAAAGAAGAIAATNAPAAGAAAAAAFGMNAPAPASIKNLDRTLIAAPSIKKAEKNMNTLPPRMLWSFSSMTAVVY